MFRIVDRRYWFFLLSALVLVPGFISLVLHGVPLAIDFTGGTLWEVAFDDPERASETALRDIYVANGLDEVQVVETETTDGSARRFQIRSEPLLGDQKQALEAGFVEELGTFTELRYDSVGPSVGREVGRNASIAVVMAAIGILIYLSWQFRNVPHSIRYGVCAVVAIIHDVLVVMGLASIAGYFLKWDVDALFLTALLTVIGFSVHDSIVVFDRIRENVGRMRGVSFARVVNHSIIQTLDRSINTQLTALFALVAIYVFSDGHLERFVFWLMIGLVSGTYSSIFNAAPLLVVWENREWRSWFGRKGSAESGA